jgi:3-hydroxyisobutyrate dehydrogenase-like beta-hydroxyacid dehydrogenase
MAMTLGFIGLGVMGEPMCRNLARKSGAAVVAFDQRAEPLAALARDGVAAAGSAGEVLARADLIKDLSYALALAESAGVKLEQAATTKRLMERTMEAGYRDNYYTAVIRTIAPR